MKKRENNMFRNRHKSVDYCCGLSNFISYIVK